MRKSDERAGEMSGRRRKLSTANLGAAVVAAVGGVAAVPAVADALLTTHFATGACYSPPWTGAQTRSPVSSAYINVASRCAGGPVGWGRAWIHNQVTNSVWSTSIIHGAAGTGLHKENNQPTRAYTKEEGKSYNPYPHVVYASSTRNP
jgi:hypothetical protein